MAGPWEKYQAETPGTIIVRPQEDVLGQLDQFGQAPPAAPTPAAGAPWTKYQAPQTQSSATDDERRTVIGFLGNMASSTGHLLGSVVNVPAQVTGLTSLFAGMAEKSGFKPLPGAPDTNAVDALIAHYKDRYGSWEGFKKAMYDDPAGVAFDASMVLEPAAGALKLAGLPRAAALTTQVGRAINPVAQTMRLAGAASRLPGLSIDVPAIPNRLNPVEQAAVDYLREQEVPLRVGTQTGNKFVRSAEALTAHSPLGAPAAEDFARGTQEGLQRVAANLAAEQYPAGPVSPEAAAQSVSKALGTQIERLGAESEAGYEKAWVGRNDPQFTTKVPVGTEEVTHPDGSVVTEPVMKSVNMPVDVRGIKVLAAPLKSELDWSLSRTEQSQSAAYNALDKILNGDDYIPAWQAERGLSALKTMARTDAPSGVRTFSQGSAAGLVGDLQDSIDAAVAATGDEAIRGLQTGRARHANKMEIAEIADKLRTEPVQNFDKLTWSRDTGIAFLRKIQEQAPEVMPQIGRAYLDQLIDLATREGGFGRARSILSKWQNLGPETKAILFPDEGIRTSLNNFFQGAEMAGQVPNPSGTALVSHAASVNPARILAGYAGSKLLFSPAGQAMLMQGFRIPLLRPAAPFIDVIRRPGGPPPGGGLPAEVGRMNPVDAEAAFQSQRAAAVPFAEMGPHGPILRDFRHNAPAAIDRLTQLGEGEAIAALHHPEIGDIDLPWGEAGDPAKNFTGGYGLAHIAAKHPEVLNDLQRIIENLPVKQRGANRIHLEDSKHIAKVRLDWDGQAKRWLLTAFAKE